MAKSRVNAQEKARKNRERVKRWRKRHPFLAKVAGRESMRRSRLRKKGGVLVEGF